MSSNNGSVSPYAGFTDPIMVNKVQGIARDIVRGWKKDRNLNVLNRGLSGNVTSLSRDTLAARGQPDPRRDINDECGFPDWISAELCQDYYDRQSIAARVVEILPKECWQTQPSVFETRDDVETEFEAAWDNLSRQLGWEDDWYLGEEGSDIWSVLRRADILSGIGHYGIILLGLDDGKDLREPVIPRPGLKLTSLTVFSEALAPVTVMESDRSSRRRGFPKQYLVTFNDPRIETTGLVGATTSTENVHWSRVIHIAEDISSNPVWGTPRMKPVWNNLQSLEKLYGGSGEMFWQAAMYILSLETHPQLGGDVDIDVDSLKDMMEEIRNSLQRYMVTSGMAANVLSPTVSDPTAFINVHIEAICIKGGYPIRIFKGSERGELASTQDDDAWNDRLIERRNSHITPRLIRPLVNRLINLGVLPQPAYTSENQLKPGYFVEWTDLTSRSLEQTVAIGNNRTTALAQYISGGCEHGVTFGDFLTKFLGFSDEDADAIQDNRQAEEEMGGGDEENMLSPADEIKWKEAEVKEAEAKIKGADVAKKADESLPSAQPPVVAEEAVEVTPNMLMNVSSPLLIQMQRKEREAVTQGKVDGNYSGRMKILQAEFLQQMSGLDVDTLKGFAKEMGMVRIPSSKSGLAKELAYQLTQELRAHASIQY